MQYTASKCDVDIFDTSHQYKHEQFNLEIGELYQAFSMVYDPRRAQGRVYWLPSVLCLAVAAILCNRLSVLAIAEWASGLSPAFRQALGLPKDRSPNQSTLHRLFCRLDPHQLSRALTEFFEQHTSRGRVRKRAEQAVAVDGKARKGQLQFEGGNACTIHDIEAFCHEIGVVLAQLALDNQHGEAELTGAPKLVSSIDWQGRIMTGKGE